MGEKYGLASDHSLTDIRECHSYEDAVRNAAGTTLKVVYYAHGQWWF